MLHAAKTLAGDFLSAIVFVAVYASTGNLPLAVAAVLATALGQIGLAVVQKRRLDPMVWLGLFLAVAFSAAALISNDPRFVMAKPSVIHAALGLVMLRRGWMTRYLPDHVRGLVPEAVVIASGYGWAAYMMALAALNLLVALFASFQTWAWFVSVGLLGAKIVAFVAQYAVFRVAAMRRAKRTLAASAPLNGAA